MYIVTVVKDFDFYNKCVKQNDFNRGAKFVVYDNTIENIGIPKHYNDFLDNYNYDDPQWICFCHEDWQPLEPWLNKLSTLNQHNIYGTLGTCIKRHPFCTPTKHYIGQIHVSNKDGSDAGTLGKFVPTGTNVETFDCMAIFIHSSLIKEYHIRFDENLDFHHYAEELCIRLREEHGIRSKIFQMNCKHWSYGVKMPNDGFLTAFNYVKNKFSKTKRTYSNTTIDEVIGLLKEMPIRCYDDPYIEQAYPNKKLPIFQHRVSFNGERHAYYFLGLQVMKLYPDKTRLCLLGIPIMTISHDTQCIIIKLFALIPILKLIRKHK